MNEHNEKDTVAAATDLPPTSAGHDDGEKTGSRWRAAVGRSKTASLNARRASMSTAESGERPRPLRARWTMGMLNDPETDAVPGSVLLLSKPSEFNEPLGLDNTPPRNSASSLRHNPNSRPSSVRSSSVFRRRRSTHAAKKRTADGKFVLDPQPDDSLNDPLNWHVWRRDAALLSLGFYCMLGGGMTPILAAGFNEVAHDYAISVPRVALTTGLYMLGLGLGSVLLAPTAILWGKRPVYLVAAVCFALSAVWCALSPSFTSLVLARVFQGLAVSSVECLPSATVAEIYFLHEKAYRLGIYTLLLLGGKNLVPLVSAVVIEARDWRWVFWGVAIIVAFAAVLLFFFVPETFWDRNPVPPRRPRSRPSRKASGWNRFSLFHRLPHAAAAASSRADESTQPVSAVAEPEKKVVPPKHAHFSESTSEEAESFPEANVAAKQSNRPGTDASDEIQPETIVKPIESSRSRPRHHNDDVLPPAESDETIVDFSAKRNRSRSAVIQVGQLNQIESHIPPAFSSGPWMESTLAAPSRPRSSSSSSSKSVGGERDERGGKSANAYTTHYANQPPKSFMQHLAPFSGRLTSDTWLRVAARPFVLFAYPAILWSALVYSLSIGWLIVLSESISTVYERRNTYNFTPLQAGLVYLSPFIGGILGTAVAGKCSDLLVRALARRNGGVYEPEFRLLMALPIALSTGAGLMGYGWSAANRDNVFVPTVFFGLISFGCALGSTTAITFALDSHRQLAGEALVTLNFSKNVLHGLVFSLFFNSWLDRDGSKEVFIVIGVVQVGCLVFATVPMYVFGKRARMWTVRRKLMERL